MKKFLEITCVLAGLLAGLIILGMVGHGERTEEIIRSMDRDVYFQIRDSLKVHGEYPSDSEVAEFYIQNY